MPKRGENIRKRKDGRWEGRYKAGKRQDGTTKYVSIYGKTYKETKEKMIKAKNFPVSGRPDKTTMLFSELLELWIRQGALNRKGATELKYHYVIQKHILPDLGNLPLWKINESMICSYLESKLQCGRLDGTGGLSLSYVKTIRHIIRSSTRFGAEQNLCDFVEANLYLHKPADKATVFLSKSEQKKLENYITSHESLEGTGVLISLYAGLRIGEVCALKWGDIDMQSSIIHVRHTISREYVDSDEDKIKSRLILETPKTRFSARDIPITSNLAPYLEKACENRISEYVVSNKCGFTNPRSFEYRFHRLLENAGLESFNYHALRHTFATRCIEVGVDAKTLSELLGHANVGTTLQIYTHSSMNLKREQIEKLSATC